MTPRDLALLTGTTLTDGSWRDGALCAGVDSDSFFSADSVAVGGASRASAIAWGEPRDALASAKALCAACPVVTACLEHALRTPEPHGIWGGTSPADRESILLGLAG